MSNPQFIKLPSNGVTFALNALRIIARKDLNQYLLVIEGTSTMPHATGTDVEFIESQLTILKMPEPEPAKSGLAVGVDDEPIPASKLVLQD